MFFDGSRYHRILDATFVDGEGNSRLLKRTREPLDLRCAPLDLDRDPVAVVQHEPRQPMALRQREDERTEPDALHDSPDGEASALHPWIVAFATGACRRHDARDFRR